MKFRRLTAWHADALGMTEAQIVQLGKVLSSDSNLGDDLQAERPGPGGGPDATPYNMTKVVMAALANGPQSLAGEAIFRLYNVQPEGNCNDRGGWVDDDPAEEPTFICCVITGEGFFGAAVRAILATPALADTIERIEVRRGTNDASIVARDGRVQRFVDHHTAREVADSDQRGDLQVVASLGGLVLAEIARDLRDE
jgi:hypothetical protein